MASKKELLDEKESELVSALWAEIESYDEVSRVFRTDGDRVYSLYVNEPISGRGDLAPASRFDILWSNTQLLQPIIFSLMPEVYVERRFKDKDPQGRRASLLLERCIKAVLSLQDSVGTFKHARDDYLLPGRGQVWSRYEPVFDKQVDEATGESTEVLKYENVAIDYVPWKDFGYSNTKVWAGVKSVWRHLYLTKKDAELQLGKEEAKKLKYTYSGCTDPKRAPEEDSKLHKRAKVTEFWDYDSKKIYWLSESNKQTIIKQKDDFLKLKNFFPCPKPLFATKRTDSLIPVSDFSILRYIIDELDTTTMREAYIMDAMKASGVSSAQVAASLEKVFQSDDCVIQPIKEWITLKQQGGTQGSIEWLPLEMFAKVLEQLRARKQELKADIYELSGITDAIRGTTSPYESSAAIQQKISSASERINEKKRIFQEFIKDTVNIVAEIISEHFSDETIREMSGVDMLGPEYVDNFTNDIALLRNDVTRNFRIDVTLESLSQADEQLEKQSVNEFINAMAQIMGQSQQVLQVMPELKPVMLEALKFAVRRYRAGRTLEGLLESTIDQALAAQAEAANQPPQEDPMLLLEQAKVDAENQKNAQKAELEQIRTQHKIQMDQTEISHKIETDRLQFQLDQEKAMNDLETERGKLMLKEQEIKAREETAITKIKSEVWEKRAKLTLDEKKAATEALNQLHATKNQEAIEKRRVISEEKKEAMRGASE